MGTLQVVATPIGNLEDVTLRALRALREAEYLYAEDTRRVRTLLREHSISARPVSLHADNEVSRIEEILEHLNADARVVIVSDAGTPLVSDPGARLVAAAVEQGHRVEGVPGPSAVLTALSVCGLRTHPFTFVGFLPRRSGPRRRLLETYRDRPETLVIFEAPTRIHQTLSDLAEVLGPQRPSCLARELTKLHEQVIRADLGALAQKISEPVRGEVTLVVEGAESKRLPATAPLLAEAETVQRIQEMTREGKRPREIAAQLARCSDLPRRELYARAVSARTALQGSGSNEDEASRD